ncbi:MAG: VWA domain-containing protein [Chloroflexi bacterium]|nr:VWA domain-containing protein [Chloroflexota bacterium]
MNGQHFLNNAVLFVQSLRQAGLPVSQEQTMDFVQALTYIDIGDHQQFYFAARCMLLSNHEHLRLFDTIFNRFWDIMPAPHGQGQKAPRAPRHLPEQKPYLFTYMATRAQDSDPELEVVDKSGTFSPAEVLQAKDFSHMTSEELNAVKRLIQDMHWKASFRRTRRRVATPKGDMLHMRRVMASAVRYGGVPLRLSWQSRKIKPRPIVLLADISGSMEKYSRIMLQFLYSVSHSLNTVECFVFGTRLTRITPQLKIKNIDRAIEEAAHTVIDWSGGTRIGESLHLFNRRWSHRVLGRGAIVIIVSDGWERGDVNQLKNEMRYLQLRCHRLIWLNPLLGNNEYEPLVEGMAAALSYVDDFLPCHNLQSIEAFGKQLAQIDA